jgi:YD repeat-containing protein
LPGKDNYAYDKNANVASIADWREGISNRGLEYDGLNRVTRVNAPSMWGDAYYTYDALDNLITAQLTAGGTARTTTHKINPATNLLDSITDSAGRSYNFVYGYDSRDAWVHGARQRQRHRAGVHAAAVF